MTLLLIASIINEQEMCIVYFVVSIQFLLFLLFWNCRTVLKRESEDETNVHLKSCSGSAHTLSFCRAKRDMVTQKQTVLGKYIILNSQSLFNGNEGLFLSLTLQDAQLHPRSQLRINGTLFHESSLKMIIAYLFLQKSSQIL